MTTEHEELAAVTRAVLDGRHVGGAFHHAKLRAVALGVFADGAYRFFTQGAAALAVADLGHGLDEGLREMPATGPVPLQ